MKLRAVHKTSYQYSAPVSICHTEVRLAPRKCAKQQVVEHQLSIEPVPDETFERKDYFGNDVTYFSIQEPHQTLSITGTSLIEMENETPPHPQLTPAWEGTVAELRHHADPQTLNAFEFTFPSPRIELGAEYAAYALSSFTERRPLLEAALDLCHCIYEEFEYDKQATTVTTPVAEVLLNRRGVCQDFVHFAVACLRSIGIGARYVSGYLGRTDLAGIGESHAWVSVFCPQFGWLDLDPTNDQMANSEYVTLAWGRDYSDVAPVKGVVVGSFQHFIKVSVEVTASENPSN